MREHTYISSDIFLSDTFLRGFVHTGLGGRKHQCSLIHLALIVLLGTKSFRNILPTNGQKSFDGKEYRG